MKNFITVFTVLVLLFLLNQFEVRKGSWFTPACGAAPLSGNQTLNPEDEIPFYFQLSSISIGQEIGVWQRFLIDYGVPDYLPASSHFWGPIIRFFRQEYDEQYFSARKEHSIAVDSLFYASRSLDQGDTESARKYLDNGIRFIKLMSDTDILAIQIWTGQIHTTRDILFAVYEATEEAVKFGVGVTLGINASLVVEALYLHFDFVVDRSMYGEDIAIRKYKDSFRDILVKVALGKISVGGKTVDKWVSEGVSHEIGASKIYSILDEILQNSQLQAGIMQALAFVAE